VEQCGIEDPAGIAQGATGDPVTTEQTLDVVERAGLLNAPQAFDDRMEEGPQQQAGVLVVEQASIPSAIACGCVFV
jgi:hypothetical protein